MSSRAHAERRRDARRAPGPRGGPASRGRVAARALALALLALAAGAPGARTARADAAPASGGTLALSAAPAALVLGRDGAAELRVGAPADAEGLAVSASAGRIEGLTRVAPGHFTARYRPPADRIPRVVILAAVARGAAGPLDGWLALPLSGQVSARVRTVPGASITLRVGDATFGPRTAGPDGVAVLPLVVPPGVREAHHGFRPLELRVPETTLLHAVADRDAVRADATAAVRVLAFVVAPHGAARRAEPPAFEPSRGRVAVEAREPGAFVATWTLPPGPAGEERLLVRVPGAPASRALVRVSTLPGPPASVAIAFDRAALVAGEAEAVTVTATVRDAAGNPVAAEVALEADGGALGPAAPAGPGEVRARLAVAPRFRGRSALTVTARVPALGLSGARALPLLAGPPATARFDAPARVLLADGAREAALRLTVADAWDNPVVLAPAVSTGAGRVVAVSAAAEPGTWLVRWVPPEVTARTGAALEAALPGVTTRTAVTLVPPRPPAALLAGAALGADLGRGGAAAGVLVGAERAAGLARAPALAWRLDLLAGGHDGAGGARLAGAVLAGAAWRLDLPGGADGWLAAGAGPALGVGPRPGGGGARDRGAGLAARVAAGAAWRLGRASPYAELGLTLSAGTPAGRPAAAALVAGVRLDLGRLHRAAPADVPRSAAPAARAAR
jgi:hypothetical protein